MGPAARFLTVGRIGRIAVAAGALAALASISPAVATVTAQEARSTHSSLATELPGGMTLSAMAQVIPFWSRGGGGFRGGPLGDARFYLSQPLVMIDVEGGGGRWALRVTPNFETWTIGDGETSPGGWGEGFVDSRHPHSVLHEAMLSLNLWSIAGGRGSLSVGRGFVPYGTPDPMGRPGLKYPTNHHLSQVLERWTASASFELGAWRMEAGVFGGEEPRDPHDLGNIESFGDSWSARATYRFGVERSLELSASLASVLEPPEPTLDVPGLVPDDSHPRARVHLWSGALQRSPPDRRSGAYWMIEGSMETHPGQATFFSLLAEAEMARGPERPYMRVEYARRPEFARFGPSGTDDFFRYGFEDEPIGGTRWLITTLGFARETHRGWLVVRPFAEVQAIRVREDIGLVRPGELYGARGGWLLSMGARVFVGGVPRRMGAYGVLSRRP